MLIHIESLLTVTLARLEGDSAKQHTQYKFGLYDLSDEAFLELAQTVRAHKAEVAATLGWAPAEASAQVLEGEVLPPEQEAVERNGRGTRKGRKRELVEVVGEG